MRGVECKECANDCKKYRLEVVITKPLPRVCHLDDCFCSDR